MKLIVLLLAIAVTSGCDSGAGNGPDGDGDVDGDVDGDSDGDADGDSDGDGDGDGDGDPCTPEALVAAVSQDRIRDNIAELSTMPDRISTGGQQAAADVVMEWLDAAGVPYEELEYTFGPATFVNIEVVLPGEDLADEIYIAGAHFDAFAPGADDNASGTAGLAEIARVMTSCTYRRTVRLVFFANEETGGMGSGSSIYAGDARARGDNIQAFLNMDMIAFGPDGKELEAYTQVGQEWLVNRVVAASETYAGQPAVAIADDACG